MVFNVILAFKDDQALIQAALNELSQDELDTLMKYVYRGLNSRIEAATQLLKWHDKVVKKAGVGVIVRSLTARQTV